MDFFKIGFFSVDITYNFIDTLNKINFNNYDIIFSDFNLDDSKILELLERIKKHQHCLNVPIVLIIEESHNLILDKILNIIGGYEVITLPISPEKVSTILKRFEKKDFQ